jgi:hypothetical protein
LALVIYWALWNWRINTPKDFSVSSAKQVAVLSTKWASSFSLPLSSLTAKTSSLKNKRNFKNSSLINHLKFHNFEKLINSSMVVSEEAWVK